MKVLVCGGRDYFDRDRLYWVLDTIHQQRGPISLIIQGGARGADLLACCFAEERGISTQTFYPDWGQHGKAAGPIRNGEMIQQGKPDLVVAFSGGKGTRDCVRQAKAAGLTVEEY